VVEGSDSRLVRVKPLYQPPDVLAEADRLVRALAVPGDEAGTVYRFHDWIVRHTRYDTSVSPESGEHPSFSAAGVFFEGLAVCQGYSEALSILCNRAGIPALYMSGESLGQRHAWNLVQVDDEWYHVDATWDDPTPDAPGQANCTYLFLTDADIRKDHAPEFAPVTCDSGRFSWMHRMRHVLRLADGYWLFADGENGDRLTLSGPDGIGPTPVLRGSRRPREIRGYYPVVHGETLYFSDFDDSARICQAPLDAVLLTDPSRIQPLRTDAFPTGIVQARNLVIEGDVLSYELFDDDGDPAGQGTVRLTSS